MEQNVNLLTLTSNVLLSVKLSVCMKQAGSPLNGKSMAAAVKAVGSYDKQGTFITNELNIA
ncbi:hypothetical protein [Beduini massiliensis]|uniref:hypothetical protein n=1 Tax=Beduini massiliensis TaxID=1585974 RepID=UPI00059AAB21|nr:hypothetical protein [Beduini massiliensis]